MKNGTGSEKSTDLDGFVHLAVEGGSVGFCVIQWTSLLLLCWLLMQVVHELGHLSGAWLTGGRVVNVQLHPLQISHTIVSPNSNPTFVCLSGPFVGVILPTAIWMIIRASLRQVSHYFRFFAGFCLIANGAYLGTAFIAPVGDTLDLIKLGVPPFWMLTFGAITIPIGLWMWNGQGRHFGIGNHARPMTARESLTLLATVLILILTELAIF